MNNWEKNFQKKPYQRKAGDGANFGTAIHHQLSNLIYDDYGIGEPSRMPDINIWTDYYNTERMNDALKMWFAFLKDNPTFKPLISEQALFYESDYKYAGRLDLIAEIEGLTYLIDFKTGNYYVEYDSQVAGGYNCLYEHNYNKKVDRVALLFLDTDIKRNPRQKYNLKVYSGEDRSLAKTIFRSKIERYYAAEPSVYERVCMGE